jgi:hypothetical protein
LRDDDSFRRVRGKLLRFCRQGKETDRSKSGEYRERNKNHLEKGKGR